MLEEIGEISLLYDFYGALLPEKQREFLHLYHEENYSLAEIAELYGLSRQAVYDAVRKAQNKLGVYEDKLGLVARLMQNEALIGEIDEAIDRLVKEYGDNAELAESLALISAKAECLR